MTRTVPVHPAARLTFACLMASVVVALVSCVDTLGPEAGEREALRQAPPGLVISEPGHGAAAATGGAGASGASAVTYVSASPGTFPEASSIQIRNGTTGYSLTAAVLVIDGGFDPVAVPASAGDELELELLTNDGGRTLLTLTVPEDRPPSVVRTDPPDGRIDVAFATQPLVVFTEPMDSSTLDTSSIRLLQGGTEVPTSVGLVLESPFATRLIPDVALEPLTTYEVVVGSAVRDLSGAPLEHEVRVTFTTSPPRAAVTIVSGDDQRGRVGARLGDSLVIRVGLEGGGPLADELVIWRSYMGAIDGFGEDGSPVDSVWTRTDGDGLARVSLIPTVFRAGHTSARLPLCDSHACTVSEVIFKADASDPGATLSVVSGDGQVADAGRPSAPLVVRVSDSEGNPVQHAATVWMNAFGEGSLASDGSRWTDMDGLARVSVVPLWFGPVVYEASVDGLGPFALFRVDASDPGASIAVVSGDGQVGKANEELDTPFVVRVTNGRGEPVEGVEIEWSGGPSWGSALMRDFPFWHFRREGDSRLVGGLDSVYYTPRAGGSVWAEARLPGSLDRSVRIEAEAAAFVLPLLPDPGQFFFGPYFYGNLMDPDCFVRCLGMNESIAERPLEWVIRIPGARIVSTAVPPGGAGFDSGPLGEGDRFTFVPGIAGTWEYMDSVSGATGTLIVR